jgi:two-component system, OmpR family, response regulator ChvI
VSSANKGRSPRILIVDDEKDVTLFLETALKDHGFEVTAFNDPLEALSSFKAGMYDLILLDIRMPKINGFELYQKLQEIDGNARIGFMTAYEVYYEALRELFPDSYSSVCFIKKPFTVQDLVKRISKEMGREQ